MQSLLVRFADQSSGLVDSRWDSQWDWRATTFSMMASSNGNTFRVTGPLCGEFTDRRWIPRTKANDAYFDVVFDLRLNKRLGKQSWGWWFETSSRSLWRHCNGNRDVFYGILLGCSFTLQGVNNHDISFDGIQGLYSLSGKASYRR